MLVIARTTTPKTVVTRISVLCDRGCQLPLLPPAGSNHTIGSTCCMLIGSLAPIVFICRASK